MAKNEDIRWIQRFNHFAQAFSHLEEAVELTQTRPLSRLEEQGLIQAFEFTHELAWKSLKDFLESRGAGNLYGSKDSTRAAFKLGLIMDGDVWMEMIKSRNLSSHTYKEEVARAIARSICDSYYAKFAALLEQFAALKAEELVSEGGDEG